VSLAILVVAGVLVFNHYRNQGISAEPPGTPVSSHPPISPTPSRPSQTKPIVVGSANFTESEVLANLYADALKAKGITVSTKMDIGSREVYLRALRDNSISLIPEYTGSLLQSLDANAKAKTADQIYQALPAALGSHLKALKPSAATDQDVYVVTKGYSAQNGITSLADVRKVSGNAVLGASSSVKYSTFGPLGVQRIYGATFKEFKPYESSAAKAEALNDNLIQFATFYTTESVISENGYVELTDPRSMILPQNVVPLMRADAAEDPTATTALEAVQAALTTADLRAMDKSVDVDHQSAARVAAEWLKSKNLA
jgi:osmoprotectant transport system substrate-binding protein